MNPKTFMILAVAVVAAAGAVLLLSQGKQSMDNFGPVFEGFDIEEINDVHTLNLNASSRRKVSMSRDSDGRWRVLEKKNYPADLVKIRKLLVAISEAERVELKTSRSDQYTKLKLADPAETDYKAAYRVDIITSDETHSLFVGDIAEGIEKGQYIRIPGEKESWLVNQRIWIDMEVNKWLDKRIIHLEPDNIHKIDITPPEGEDIHLVRAVKGEELELENVPEGRKPKGGGTISRLATFPDFLEFNEIRGREKLKIPEEDVTKAVITTFDGLELHYTGYPQGTRRRYGVFDVKENTEVAEKFGISDEDKAAVNKKLDRLTKRLSPWFYEIRHSAYNLFKVDMEKLTEAVEEEKEQ